MCMHPLKSLGKEVATEYWIAGLNCTEGKWMIETETNAQLKVANNKAMLKVQINGEMRMRRE